MPAKNWLRSNISASEIWRPMSFVSWSVGSRSSPAEGDHHLAPFPRGLDARSRVALRVAWAGGILLVARLPALSHRDRVLLEDRRQA